MLNFFWKKYKKEFIFILVLFAGLHPGFLSFSEINHEWKIAEMMEYKKRPPYQQVENTMRIFLNRANYDIKFINKSTNDFPLKLF